MMEHLKTVTGTDLEKLNTSITGYVLLFPTGTNFKAKYQHCVFRLAELTIKLQHGIG